MLDAEEWLLSEGLTLIVRHVDRAHIAREINDSMDSQNAFRNHLGKYLDPVKQIGSAQCLENPAASLVLCRAVSQKQDTICPQLSKAVQIVFSIIFSFFAAKDIKRQIALNLVIITTAVSVSLAIGKLAEQIWGINI